MKLNISVELKHRLLTAVAMLSVVIALLLGAHFFTAFRYLNLAIVFTLICFASYEVTTAVSNSWQNLKVAVATLVLLLIVPLLTMIGFVTNNIASPLLFSYVSAIYPLLGILCVVFLLVFIEILVKRKSLENESLVNLNLFLPAFLLVGIGGASLLIITVSTASAKILTWLILVVTLNDTAAYFLGKKFGTTKIAEGISPNKTIVGSLSGLCAAVIFGFLFKFLFAANISNSVFLPIIIAILVGFIAQIGDLAKSYIKRNCGIKDFGNLLPGHGGILDRIDALLAASPVICLTYLFLNF